jgi:murein DD-endopeptidase MepM/ murein hydrolase activator NlpD
VLTGTTRATGERIVKRFGRVRGFREALVKSGASGAEADALVTALQKVVDFTRGRPEHSLIFERDAQGKLEAFEYQASVTERFRAERKPDGSLAGRRVVVPVERRRIVVGGYVADSLGRALEARGLKSTAAGLFVEAFEGKIDFKRDVREGDSFRVIVEEELVEGQSLGYGRPVALQYTGSRKGDVHAFWFETSPKVGDFYDDSGRGLHGGWLRTPLRYDHISSPFNLRRRHPILKRVMPHNGMDYAAAPGTTVWAAADGTVTFAGARGPNGNLVVLQHAGGHETFYAHLLRVARGITKGVKVKQRQAIGAVGSTGRSTGPHLHFSLKRHGRFLDPAKQLNGPGQLLPAASMSRFKQVAAQLKRELARIPLAAAPAPIGGADPEAAEDFHEDTL